jgi:hypothetical protein
VRPYISRPVLEGVWELLERVAPRLPALRGVTFEFHESSWPFLHEAWGAGSDRDQ